jgi:putative two-component system response regulator
MHLERISRMCERVGLELGMTATEAETPAQRQPAARRRQDRVPDAILPAAQRAVGPDREQMRLHTTVGAELLSGASSDVMRMAEEIARTHHERWDGDGYPAGLAGEAIPPARPDLRGVRRLRRAALRAPLQGAVVARGRPWRSCDETAGALRPEVVDAFLRIVDSLDPELVARRPRSPAIPVPGDTPAPRAAAPRSG